MKCCKMCNQFKSFTEFCLNSRTKDGYYYYCKDCQKLRKYAYLQNDDNYNKRKDRDKVTRDQLRIQVLKYYSNCKMECACCKDKHLEFLSLDHINGNGRKERLQINNRLWNYLIRNNFPIGYRVLCHNCNQAIGLYGYCPHEKERQQIIPITGLLSNLG